MCRIKLMKFSSCTIFQHYLYLLIASNTKIYGNCLYKTFIRWSKIKMVCIFLIYRSRMHFFLLTYLSSEQKYRDCIVFPGAQQNTPNIMALKALRWSWSSSLESAKLDGRDPIFHVFYQFYSVYGYPWDYFPACGGRINLLGYANIEDAQAPLVIRIFCARLLWKSSPW